MSEQEKQPESEVQITGNPANQQNTPIMEQALEFLTRPVRQTMREDIFERDFLPFFDLRGIEREIVDEMLADMERSTGLKQTERDLVGNMISRWMGYVRSAYLETDIVNPEGKILFSVPPLLRSPDEIISCSGEKMAQLIETANNHYNVHPNEGNKFFINRILPNLVTHHISIEELQKWNIIFDYYGLPRYTIPGEEAPAGAGVAGTTDPVDEDSSCDYEFDDE